MAKKPTFVGFSTHNKISPPYTLTDIELVKQDLLNALMTRKGERVMRPEFGCRVWDYLYDPFDDFTKQAIEDDVIDVIQGEPRVRLQGMKITETEHGINIALSLMFLPGTTADTLLVLFKKKGEDSI